MKNILFTALIVSLSTVLLAQNTVGLTNYDPSKAYDGYNLIFPHKQGNVFLLDNCGEIVNTWEDTLYTPGNTAYLTEAGQLYVCKGNGANSNSFIHAGGGGELVEIREWDNTLSWQWFYNDSTVRLHHDIAVMPNGNFLAIAWEVIDSVTAVAAGRDSTYLSDGEIWPEHIIEIEPIGTDSGNIVWEWHAWDHLIQNFDSTKANYGDPSVNPGKIDVNFGPSKADWHHMNAIDYNPFLDQIVMSVPNFDELWIIDHSTTTAQAAGVLGDLIYRWGNPEAYGMGDSSDQKLFYQHDVHWADISLSAGNPAAGKLAVFNNRTGEAHSTVHLINAIYDDYELEYPMTSGVWDPTDFHWSYQRPDSTEMFSNILSSVQFLENGNKLICTGRSGYAFEIDDNEDIVWEYKTPLSNGFPVAQGTVLAINENFTFRMNRYPADYPAFTGKDMLGKGFIELNPDTTFCSNIIGIDEAKDLNEHISILPNPANSRFTIVFDPNSVSNSVLIYDVLGKVVWEVNSVGNYTIDVPVINWEEGIYFVRLNEADVQKLVVSH